jgi:hypothetical protein
LFVENWKWTWSWPLLLFVINFSVLFACILFLGKFSMDLLSRTQHQAFSVKFCRISWMPEHDVETKWLQFKNSFKILNRKKSWVETLHVEQDLPRPALKNS